MLGESIREGLTFDDVLLVPAESAVLPNEVDLSTRLTARIPLKMPLLSAAMDTVTEAATAIAMARDGGIGIVHKNLSPADQVIEVTKVKKAESGIVVDPVTIHHEQKLRVAVDLMRRHNISGLPVVSDTGMPVGILTNRDIRFERDLEQRVADVMTRQLITAPEGITLEQSKGLLHDNRIEKLIVVDHAGRLKGLITIKDIEQAQRHPNACKDSIGRLRVGAAVGVGNGELERMEALLRAGCDLVVIDTAHGHSRRVVDAVREARRAFPDAQLMAGNIATAEATEALIAAGVDAVKVGVGPGSICTTRVVAGVGVPQVTAISDCAKVAAKKNIPVVADGGVKHSGDIVKALAAGANCVMIGSLFAGTKESPGEIILFQGRSYKVYRGMGSLGAMGAGSKDRYFQGDVEAAKLVPEGIEGRVPYKGTLADSVYQLLGGLRSGMGYLGCGTIEDLRQKPRFIKITSAGLVESHVHDVIITKEAPNYRVG